MVGASWQIMLSVMPYIPTNKVVMRMRENVTGYDSTTFLNALYTTAKIKLITRIRAKYSTRAGFIRFSVSKHINNIVP